MCGIPGSVNFKLSYQNINQSMFRRGPDEQNRFLVGNIYFYPLRLAIHEIGGATHAVG